MTYHQTKDILFVKKMLGHRALQNTLRYTQLVEIEEENNYTCKVAKSPTEAVELVEAGFEYVSSWNECQLFRKRK